MTRCPQQWMNKEAFARVSGNQAGDGEVADVRCVVLCSSVVVLAAVMLSL